MLYNEQDMTEISQTLRKRIWLTVFPGGVFIIAAIVIFIIGQQNRVSTWGLTTLLFVLGGSILIFGHGVAIKPAKIYRDHIGYMLGKDQRRIEGVLKSFSEDVSLREGLSCHAVMINIGDLNDEEDDRLYYFDTYKKLPDGLIGKKVCIESNNKMISSITAC